MVTENQELTNQDCFTLLFGDRLASYQCLELSCIGPMGSRNYRKGLCHTSQKIAPFQFSIPFSQGHSFGSREIAFDGAVDEVLDISEVGDFIPDTLRCGWEVGGFPSNLGFKVPEQVPLVQKFKFCTLTLASIIPSLLVMDLFVTLDLKDTHSSSSVPVGAPL